MNILIVDMIEGFTRKGVLASPRVEALIPKQVEFLKQVPDDSYVVFACDSHLLGDSEFKRMPEHCIRGSKECNICPELMEVVRERGLTYQIVFKRTHSAFFETDMDHVMKEAKAYYNIGDDWVVFGCVTDICIAANVAELDYRGKNITLVRDLIDTYEITEDQAVAMGSKSKTHTPSVYNDLFFDYYFPGVWGVKVTTAYFIFPQIFPQILRNDLHDDKE